MERIPAHGFKTLVAAMLFVLMPGIATAQEEAETPTEDAPRRFTVDFEGWIAQPVGHEFGVATLNNADNPFDTKLLEHGRSTEDKLRYGLAYRLPGETGEIALSYYVHDQASTLREFSPGEFVFGQLLTHSLYGGVNNDGRADAFVSDSQTFLRDWRLEFRRNAYRSERLSLDWALGWKRVLLRRELGATYYATFPDFPPLLPPIVDCCPNLDPLPDTAGTSSRFEGRGPAAGLRAELPLWKDRIVVEAGLNLAVLRGKADPSYASTTSYYRLNFLGQSTILEAPYTVFGQRLDPSDGSVCSITDPLFVTCIPAATVISQPKASLGLGGQSVSTDGQALEADIALRWRAKSWLEVTAGIRSSRYDDVIVELRPDNVTAQPDGSTLSFDDFTRETRSITYEGLYGGLRFRFW